MSTTEQKDNSVYQDHMMRIIVFMTLFAVRCFSALYNTIPDADDTFNFWEPTHYLAFNFGMQTWEYSAEYGLRSYTILLPFALFSRLMHCIFTGNKVYVFYSIRILLGFLSALAETTFIRGTQKVFGKATAIPLYMLLLCSSGMYTASTSFVNSSLAMTSVFFSYGIWMVYENHWLALLIGAGAVVYDWSFVGVAFIPMGLDCLRKRGIKTTLFYGISIVCIILGVDLCVNYHYTHHFVIPAINIVLYNVLGIGGGPELYGVEPWYFYIVNGILNNSIVVPLFLIMPLLAILVRKEKVNMIYTFLITSSGYILFLIFCLQNHKEERFLYITYPALFLSAALAINFIVLINKRVVLFLSKEENSLYRDITTYALFLFLFVPYVLLSLSRISSSIHNYHAPLSIYNYLYSKELGQNNEEDLNICVGKEWYRYGSSYFIPSENQQLQFIKSGFDGLLPQRFSKDNGTWIHPEHMNNLNKEDPSRYIPVSACDYIIEQRLPQQVEEDYLQDPHFRMVIDLPFLDHTHTRFPYRSYYLPFPFYEQSMHYNHYYLIRHITTFGKGDVEVCIDPDTCVLQSSETYLNEDTELYCVYYKHVSKTKDNTAHSWLLLAWYSNLLIGYSEKQSSPWNPLHRTISHA